MHPIWNSIKIQKQMIDSAHRNIATCYPSQDLFDDLIDSKSISILQKIENRTSGIDHQRQQKERVFQYFDTQSTLYIFQHSDLWGGRFSDGSFGVWYGALEEQTSIDEALFWWSQFVKPDFENTRDPITTDRRMFRVKLSHKLTADFRPLSDDYPQLTHPHDYTFCHKLGHEAVTKEIGYSFTPSARSLGGTCLPTFQADAIVEEQTIYYLKFIFSAGKKAEWTRSPFL